MAPEHDPQHSNRLAALREDYQLGGLAESDLTDDPIDLFRRWLDDAVTGGVYDPNAMVVATVDGAGRPSARAVLLKDVGPDGFRFFTNYGSRKATDLEVNPACALTFGWFALQRQVRIEGVAIKAPRADAETYFASRPRASQVGAWASVEPVTQSGIVADRDALQSAYDAAQARFDAGPVPCPPGWGGYDVRPDVIEFWQGRSGRMHDRLRYARADTPTGWHVDRLAP